MARYIDVEPIISESEKELKILKQKMLRGVSGAGAAAGTLTGIIARLADTPTAEVEEVKHGEWVTVYSENGYHKECSVCGSRWMLDSKEHVCKETKRCYECGAKMDGRK